MCMTLSRTTSFQPVYELRKGKQNANSCFVIKVQLSCLADVVINIKAWTFSYKPMKVL
jgi:hypothetical protein